MSTYSASSYYPAASGRVSRISIFKRFIEWCTAQDKNRFGWLAAILTSHGCILAPITMFAIFGAGLGFVYIAFTIAAMAICVISNLAAMPTRFTIPVYFFSVLIDLVIIAVALYSLVL